MQAILDGAQRGVGAMRNLALAHFLCCGRGLLRTSDETPSPDRSWTI
jgi:hypothetical protein